MKKYFLFMLLVIVTAVACTNATSDKQKTTITDTASFTTVQWLDSAVSFGTITMGEKIDVKFRMKNTGNKPLVLEDVHPGCGCTVADYTKEPIAPGGTGLITASFDSNKSHPGEVRKTVTVKTNTKNAPLFNLLFTGQIKEKS